MSHHTYMLFSEPSSVFFVVTSDILIYCLLVWDAVSSFFLDYSEKMWKPSIQDCLNVVSKSLSVTKKPSILYRRLFVCF